MEDALQTRIFVSADGVRLVADHGGAADAPAVILLHGGGQTRHSWSRAVARLVAEGFQVVNFDARGHGESDWSANGAYSLTDRVADLRAIVETLSVPHVLVGASLGGGTAILAVDEGLRPAGLVVVDIVPEPNPEGIDRIVGFMRSKPEGFANVEEAVAAVAAYNPQRRTPPDPNGLMKNLRAGEDGRLRWHWDPEILSLSPTILNGIVQRASQRLGSLPDLPVLLVRGLSSDVVSDAGVAAFRKTVPHLEVLDVAGAGHMVAGDRNDAFNDGIIAFARRVLGAASAETLPIPG
ncbi:MAG: alpha/beta hydrolase [Sphingomonadales bacterium RIFCSPHIGHO2_01_FULL_65_20]|uniref:alpha/beta fold hydrolase n=1 Tax=Blastomonas sp. TaxID=1909299 RepID=UPI0008D65BA2|nr:alpha/beta hydrolase [Blastomonas sp.]OHC92217.1 MAG: alpha/beta hydrolase [Sphingomonadales bacterium RIFCSPHIGHO2_01_FULL_65_20]